MSMTATTTRALAAVLVLIGLAVPAHASVPAGEVGLDNPPATGTDGYICYSTPIDPPIPQVDRPVGLPLPDAVGQDDTCRKDIQVVELPIKVPPTPLPAPTTITVHYRTIPVERPPVGYVPVQDGVLTIERGRTAGQAVVELRRSQLPEERFILEIFRPSVGTIVNPRALVIIKPRD